MPYASIDQFLAAFTGEGARAKIELPAGSGDSRRALIGQLLSAASGEIDGILREAGYALPLPAGDDSLAVERADMLAQRCIQRVCNMLKPGHDAVSSVDGVLSSDFESWRKAIVGVFGLDGRGRLVRTAYVSLPGVARGA